MKYTLCGHKRSRLRMTCTLSLPIYRTHVLFRCALEHRQITSRKMNTPLGHLFS
jgi:hypothetical protein